MLNRHAYVVMEKLVGDVAGALAEINDQYGILSFRGVPVIVIDQYLVKKHAELQLGAAFC